MAVMIIFTCMSSKSVRDSTRTSRISTVSSQMPQPRKMGMMSALNFSYSASRFVITSTMLIWLTASRIVEMARVCTFSLPAWKSPSASPVRFL